MSHLNRETIARLVDEQPTPLEAAHLADCAGCARELNAMRADVNALAALGDIAPPAHAWTALEHRLADEGLIRRTRTTAAWLRIAAAVALFLTGTLAGFTWRSATLPQTPAGLAVGTEDGAQPGDASREQAPAPVTEDLAGARRADREAEDDNAHGTRLATVEDSPDSAAAEARTYALRGAASDAAEDAAMPGARNRGADDAAAPAVDGRAQPRITGPASADPRFASLPQFTPRNAQEAAVLLHDAESVYLEALARYARFSGYTDDAGDPLARLAALEGIVLTTREALGRAPADPIINGYHMTALAQREATLRQIAAKTTSPWF